MRSGLFVAARSSPVGELATTPVVMGIDNDLLGMLFVKLSWGQTKKPGQL
jgi:hypothetical protein